MKSIVVPVHFTPRSTNAARYAADLAAVLGADLKLMYVLQLSSDKPLAGGVIEEIRYSGLESLKSLADELRRRTGGKVRISADQQTGEPGKISERIQALCKEAKPFLVVAGGPVDRRLKCPVLIVPDRLSFHPIHKIIIACDRGDILSGMADQMAFLAELHNGLGCSFELIHVVRDGEPGIDQLIREYGEWKSRPVFFPRKLHFVRQDEPRQGISEYLENHSADLLMVIPKSHSWIEFHDSQAKTISESGKLPVISLCD